MWVPNNSLVLSGSPEAPSPLRNITRVYHHADLYFHIIYTRALSAFFPDRCQSITDNKLPAKAEAFD